MTTEFALHHRTLESYFFEEIEAVQERTGKALPIDVEAYVVGLLARYATRTHAAGRASRPLAIDYLKARDEAGSVRANALRRVGDRALYISGVAPRSLDRTPISVSYVKGIGEAAYREVSSARTGAATVLGDLAERFDDVAEVIGDVVELGGVGSDDLLSIYERWRTHGDHRDLRRLVSAGVLIDAKGSDTLQ